MVDSFPLKKIVNLKNGWFFHAKIDAVCLSPGKSNYVECLIHTLLLYFYFLLLYLLATNKTQSGIKGMWYWRNEEIIRSLIWSDSAHFERHIFHPKESKKAYSELLYIYVRHIDRGRMHYACEQYIA